MLEAQNFYATRQKSSANSTSAERPPMAKSREETDPDARLTISGLLSREALGI